MRSWRKDRETLVRPGEVSLLVPEVDEIHQMDNTSNRPTVEVTSMETTSGDCSAAATSGDGRGAALRDDAVRQLLVTRCGQNGDSQHLIS